MKRGIPAWLDVKDLRPGVFWNRDLEAALDAASCMVLLASPDSMQSPNVRAEWQRAQRQGKRIVIALFRSATLPAELPGREIVDFRGAFTPALKRLIEHLHGAPRAPKGVVQTRFSLALPPWVAVIAFTLLVPLAGYFLLADWKLQGTAESPAYFLFLSALLPLALFALAWFLGVSFLRRRMGMTHLLTCFAFGAAWTCYPLLLYAVSGPAFVANDSQPFVQAVAQHQFRMMLLGALPLLGAAILLVIQPQDLLRWTPVGKAWGWFRARRTPKIPAPDGSNALRSAERFYLLHDPLDEPAAARLRRELTRPGVEEAGTQSSAQTLVLLLTNRTRPLWLAHAAKQPQSPMLTVVGAPIALPAELDWLWQREWIDFRHWDLNRLDRKSGLMRVPEAVSGVRFPSSVRLAHHLLCALLALSVLLVGLPDPSFAEPSNGSDFAPQNLLATVITGLSIWYILLARRLLRRTISESAFYRLWPIALVTVCLEAAWSFDQAVLLRHFNVLRILPVAAFLIAWPVLFLRNRSKLAFWFPSTRATSTKRAPSLACKRNWQTLIWLCLYLAIWDIVLGLSQD